MVLEPDHKEEPDRMEEPGRKKDFMAYLHSLVVVLKRSFEVELKRSLVVVLMHSLMVEVVDNLQELNHIDLVALATFKLVDL